MSAMLLSFFFLSLILQVSIAQDNHSPHAASIRGSLPNSLVFKPISAEENSPGHKLVIGHERDHRKNVQENWKKPTTISILDVAQKPSTTVKTSESWFTRMKNSFVQALLGIILMVFSIPVLWHNEKRNAMMESLISIGQTECKSVSAKVPDTDMRGCLVHVSGARTTACKPVRDIRFPGAELKLGCLRLSSTVEVYQWEETQSTKEEEKLGGGKETKTTYSYSKRWSSIKIDSSSFKDHSRNNIFLNGLELGFQCTNCELVEYGDAYVLTDELVNQCNAWQDAAKSLPKTLATREGLAFSLSSDGKYYVRMSSEPAIGDARVTFQFVPEGEATIMALQDDHEVEGGKETFLPYRIIDRGCCGSISDDQKRQSLLDMAHLSKSDLAEKETCSFGPLFCCCLPCNLVAMCCGAALTPEIYNLWQGNMSKNACFDSIKLSLTLTTWLMRFLGWAMMFAGLYAFFAPLITLLSVIPFLSTLGSYAIWGLCFVVTLTVAFMVIGIAYAIYHPLLGIMYLTIAGLIFAMPQIYAAVSS